MDVQRQMCNGEVGGEATRSNGSKEDADSANGAKARWTNKGSDGQASLQDGDAVAGTTPGSNMGDQQDATSADSSDSEEPPTRTTNSGGRANLQTLAAEQVRR
ncbi:hypothetical protein Syun_003920 [Stephania yunnanensis]|uniref:Uncharacterized protein n=1 Tax=Stephania yunnanensis TaxID=152371 RepID=A0AAP0L216_9MAGN